MKKSAFLFFVVTIITAFSAFSQKNCNYSNNNFLTGIFAGIIFNEVFDINNNHYQQMYFSYKPHKNSWRIEKNFTNNTPFFFNNKHKVVAIFENPYGYRDFFVTINRHGQWQLDCPKKLVKLFKKKILKNL